VWYKGDKTCIFVVSCKEMEWEQLGSFNL